MQHDWVRSTLGHGETMCSRCKMTNREAAVLGQLNECLVELESAPKITDLDEESYREILELLAGWVDEWDDGEHSMDGSCPVCNSVTPIRAPKICLYHRTKRLIKQLHKVRPITAGT